MEKAVHLCGACAKFAFATAFFFGADMASCAAAFGWENANLERKMPSPVQELWRAPFAAGIGAFDVEWRGGAKGRVTVEDGALRIEKENDKGLVVVAVRDISLPPGQIVQGYAACYLEGSADPYGCKAYIRMWSGKENLNWVRKLFGATATDSPLFTDLVNTPSGGFIRKLCRAKSGNNGKVTAAIVVEGGASVTVWRGWGIENAAAADKAWKKRTADARRPPDRSGTMIVEDAFDAALAKDTEHSALMAKTPSGGVLQIDGRAAAPILYKPIPFGMGVPFTGEGAVFEKSGVDLQVVNIRFGVGHGRIGFWSKNGFDCAGAVKRVKDFMRTAPRSLFFLTIRCDAYPEYADEHPGEKWLRSDGSVVYGSCSQGKKHATAVPPKNTWPWVSNHSLVWRNDVKRLMSIFVGELKRTGLAKRIVGVHLAGYHDGQFAVPVADFSKPALEAFKRWQQSEFGAVRWDAAPSYPEDREFLDPETEQAQIAYQKFLKWGPMEMQEDYARHLKKEFGKPIVVGRWCMVPFGGSIMSTLDFTPFVKSDALDFLVAQPVYHRRAPGVACGVRVPLASFRANGKMFLNEFDLRTWHGRSGETEARGMFLSEATDLPMWKTIHRRLAGQMFANRTGWWYFDMADNWFDEPDIQSDIASVRAAASELIAGRPDHWRPSVAVVLDEEGMLLRNRAGRNLSMREVRNTAEQLQSLAASSVPFDILLADDLFAEKAGGDYKALVMAGFYRIDAKRAKLIASLKSRGVKLLFLADSGACGGIEACSGCKTISEPGGLTPALFNSFVKSCGGYVPAGAGLQVDMNGNFLSVHCLKTGSYRFMLPFRADAKNLKTGETHSSADALALGMTGGETVWFSLRRR
jgi:hypothetical protein